MAGEVYTEENKVYQIDFTSAVWSTDKLNSIFNKTVASVLSDVDFIAETETDILFVEYKNASVAGASKPDAFIPSSDKSIFKIAHKFYGSLLYIRACGYTKPYKYVYILEYPKGDSVTRKLIRNKIASKLPFELQKDPNVTYQLISSFDVLSIDEWNSNPSYSQFPLSLVTVITT